MKRSLPVIISIIATIGIITASVFFSNGSQDSETATGTRDTVEVVDGKQIITVAARGGYSPRKIIARADMPTVLRMTTQNTFDCSVAFTVPELDISKILPSSGSTDFDIPPQPAGKELQGLCTMGMYNFSIAFE